MTLGRPSSKNHTSLSGDKRAEVNRPRKRGPFNLDSDDSEDEEQDGKYKQVDRRPIAQMLPLQQSSPARRQSTPGEAMLPTRHLNKARFNMLLSQNKKVSSIFQDRVQPSHRVSAGATSSTSKQRQGQTQHSRTEEDKIEELESEKMTSNFSPKACLFSEQASLQVATSYESSNPQHPRADATSCQHHQQILTSEAQTLLVDKQSKGRTALTSSIVRNSRSAPKRKADDDLTELRNYGTTTKRPSIGHKTFTTDLQSPSRQGKSSTSERKSSLTHEILNHNRPLHSTEPRKHKSIKNTASKLQPDMAKVAPSTFTKLPQDAAGQAPEWKPRSHTEKPMHKLSAGKIYPSASVPRGILKRPANELPKVFIATTPSTPDKGKEQSSRPTKLLKSDPITTPIDARDLTGMRAVSAVSHETARNISEPQPHPLTNNAFDLTVKPEPPALKSRPDHLVTRNFDVSVDTTSTREVLECVSQIQSATETAENAANHKRESPLKVLQLPPSTAPDTAEPCFEYSLVQKLWSREQNETDIATTDVISHRYVDMDEANTEAEKLFGDAREVYTQHFAVHFSEWHSNRNEHGCLELSGTFSSAMGYPDKKTHLTIRVQRDFVSKYANTDLQPTRSSPYINKNAYILRLFRLPPPSENSPADNQSTASTPLRVYEQLPCCEVYTTLDAANRAARSLQVKLSHEENPSDQNTVERQTTDLADLNAKVYGLDPSMGGVKGCWKSTFNASGSSGDMFELVVEQVGICGPRN